MVTTIVSFGFKHGTPATGTVIDVRGLFRNPFRDPRLRDKPGTDPEVGQYIEQGRWFDTRYAALKTLVGAFQTDTLCIGCHGGRHRSVYLVERLGKDLGIAVEHRDIGKQDKERG